MRILFLTPWYPDDYNPNHGIFIRDQVVALAQEHNVQVVCSKIDYNRFGFLAWNKKWSEFSEVKELRIWVKRSLPVFNQVNYFLITVLETWRAAKKFQPDLIHGNIGYPGAFWSWCVSKIIRKPFLITEHTRLINNFRTPVHKFLTLYSLRRAKTVIAVSKWHADEISSYTHKRPFVIPNIVDFKKFDKVRVLPIGITQIGFLGGLDTDVKGLDILLMALSELEHEFVLHIGGKGIRLEQYKDLALELGVYKNCVFYGFVPHTEVYSFMSRLHFFVSASRSETFGLVVVEAMACGLPVVASRSGGSEEFITDESGLLVDVDDVLSMRAGIQKIILEFDTYNGQRIRETIVKKYATENFINQINILYSNIISK